MEVGCADRHSHQCIAAKYDDGMPVRRRPSDRCQDELTPEQGMSGIGYRYSFRLLLQQSVGGIALCVRTPATRMATAFARSTSTRWKGRGPDCAPGSVRTWVSRRRSCRCISAFSSSCTTPGLAAKPSSAPLLPLWSCNGPHHPGSQQEPHNFVQELTLP